MKDTWEEWHTAARAMMDGKAKPPGSLGLMEEWAVRLCALQGTLRPQLHEARLLVFAADHGVTHDEGRVSAYPRQLTAAVFSAIARGQAASCVLCAANGCSLELIDVGVDADVRGAAPPPSSSSGSSSTTPGSGTVLPAVVHAKVAPGSASFLAGPALSSEQLDLAMQEGRAAVRRFAAGGGAISRLLCVGELGIGNTTAAAALVAALTGADPEDVCGRGTGLTDEGVSVKVAVVQQALQRHQPTIAAGQPLQVLGAVGGLELAAMVGAYLEAGELGMPVVVDGFISGAAALVALRVLPKLGRCLFLSHRSAEKGAGVLVQALTVAAAAAGSAPEAAAAGTATSSSTAGGRPGAADVLTGSGRTVGSGFSPTLNPKPCPAPLDMGMRLGEGSGAVLMVPLLRSAAAVAANMASLQEVLQGGMG